MDLFIILDLFKDFRLIHELGRVSCSWAGAGIQLWLVLVSSFLCPFALAFLLVDATFLDGGSRPGWPTTLASDFVRSIRQASKKIFRSSLIMVFSVRSMRSFHSWIRLRSQELILWPLCCWHFWKHFSKAAVFWSTTAFSINYTYL